MKQEVVSKHKEDNQRPICPSSEGGSSAEVYVLLCVTLAVPVPEESTQAALDAEAKNRVPLAVLQQLTFRGLYNSVAIYLPVCLSNVVF